VNTRSDRFVKEITSESIRSDFQIDRDRILYTPHLARLAEVTQVRTLDGFLVHNRLTHSLKVAQLARRIAEGLAHKQPGLAKKLSLDPDVAEAAGLAHDMGHPPFGHIAEDELHKVVQEAGVEDGYEGNAQTYRILTRLTVGDTEPADASKPFLPGVNLTRATLNAVCKYPWTFTDRPKDKWGCYATELEIFAWARDGCAIKVKSVEAEIMDWADDITYAIHDMIDFHCAGLIPLHLLANDNETGGDLSRKEVATFFRVAFQRSEKIAQQREIYQNAFRDALQLANITGPYIGTQSQTRDLWSYSSVLIGTYLDAIELVDPDESDGGQCVSIKAFARNQTTILKELTWRYVILQNELATVQYGQRKAIRDLFGVFLEAIKSGKYELFPPGFAELIQGDTKVPPARWAADYISGLTEREVSRLHHRLNGC
jgi:dGTPase